MSKAFNKFVVSKKNFEDIFLHVERHQPDHPKVAQLKRQYPLVLSSKNIETDTTDPAPSKEDTSNETNYEAQDAGANCSTHPTQDKATTCATRDASADDSANKAEGEEQANKEGCSSPTVKEFIEHFVDTNKYHTERDEGEIIQILESANSLSISLAEGARTQISPSEQSANILKERGKLTVIEEGNEQEHSQKTVKPTSKSSKRKGRKH